MASLAAETRTGTNGAGKAPISTHPLFPAIVALWFAALLGLGSLILPTILLERLVTVTGMSAIVPQAAPPLGFTARAMLALVAAASGAVLGLLIARQVAQSHAPKPKARFSFSDARTCRPISAHDELGEEGLGDAVPRVFGQKRRSLAVTEEGKRSEYLHHVPLPGQDYASGIDGSDEALELGDFAEDNEPGTVIDQEEAMTEGMNFRQPHGAGSDNGDQQGQEFVPLDPFAGHPASDEDETDEHPSRDALPFAAPSLRRSQDVPSFMTHQFDLDEDEPVEPVIQPGTFGTPAQPASRPFNSSSAGQPQLALVEPEPVAAALAAAAADDRALDDLGLVQLAARLGASLERRRAQRAAQGESRAAAPIFADSDDDFDTAVAAEAAAARASFFNPDQHAAFEEGASAPEAKSEPDFAPEPELRADAEPLLATKPNALRGISFDDDDDGDEAYSASFSLPRQAPVASPAAEFAASDEELAEVGYAEDFADEGEDDDDADYSSLLAMKNPFQKKAEYVRIDEPEPEEDEGYETAVTFPAAKQAAPGPSRPFDPPSASGQASFAPPSDPGDADRELRTALATLQRMSGSA